MMIDRTPAGKAMLRIIDSSTELINARKASPVKVIILFQIDSRVACLVLHEMAWPYHSNSTMVKDMSYM